MTVTVYIWLPYGGNVGHASMQVPGGPYISWWPEGKDSAKGKKDKGSLNWVVSPAILSESLEEDIASEDDRQPDVYDVPVPNPGAIKKWWRKNKYGTYVVLGKNCCDVVINALHAGGFTAVTKGCPSTPTDLARQLSPYKRGRRMTVTVYIWLPHGRKVGHASMQVPGGPYISWWPEGKDSAKGKKDKGSLNWVVSPAILSESLEEDIAAEDGRQPDEYDVPVPNPDAIKKWWRKNKHGTYVVLGKNCCDMVINALHAGGFTSLTKGCPSTPTDLASQLRRYKR